MKLNGGGGLFSGLPIKNQHPKLVKSSCGKTRQLPCLISESLVEIRYEVTHILLPFQHCTALCNILRARKKIKMLTVGLVLLVYYKYGVAYNPLQMETDATSDVCLISSSSSSRNNLNCWPNSGLAELGSRMEEVWGRGGKEWSPTSQIQYGKAFYTQVHLGRKPYNFCQFLSSFWFCMNSCILTIYPTKYWVIILTCLLLYNSDRPKLRWTFLLGCSFLSILIAWGSPPKSIR